MSEPSFALVVAHYHENLNWLRRVPAVYQKFIYSKAETPPLSSHIQLPNIGREAHTYLQHLVAQYHNLSDYTVFCQGKPFDHAYDFHATLRQLIDAEADKKPFQWLGHIIDTDTPDGDLYKQWSKNETGEGLDLERFHQQLFNAAGPDSYPFVLGAQFVVSREQVHQRPQSFYQKALEAASTFPLAAHCFERTWDLVFETTGIDRNWLAGRETVYLKTIKRLI
ncbi:DUF3431 domain-containing protein [Arundinibacter roseus]|uniref:DUF3431 domain-containing protein n=1 Tax=Arundinibacter roseus TaxID=2070510 RepID=A0A4V2X9K4_9BACT|nr:DUF3431 domain-containing protein [Arundinibacter roseus]TDB64195.1 DUF3431 domain-containing protein [Arundinibacter roseus]